jgi:hypothetical protein
MLLLIASFQSSDLVLEEKDKSASSLESWVEVMLASTSLGSWF